MNKRILLLIAIIGVQKISVVCSRKSSFDKLHRNLKTENENQYSNYRNRKFLHSNKSRSAPIDFDGSQNSGTSTECVSPSPEEEEYYYSSADDGDVSTNSPIETTSVDDYQFSSPTPTFNTFEQEPTLNSIDQESKAKELRNLIQHLYVAQARVQLEAAEIKKAQAIANTAQQALEEAANHVRAITASLQSSQQEVAAAAIRAQTAQLQLAAHDQLLFAARQDVDALSSQMVGLQAAEGISQPKITVDVSDLLEKLNQPLPESDKPTPVPTIVPIVPTKAERRGALEKRYYQDRQLLPGI
ncbi:uncharacterized protein LOC109611746 [Musca domestica]|uniref:Uncharacterized protein LOC109611746 n=1 Tax=Musca domestica TaxID=7370 RepID=A0A9J7DC76_MUSDO|nr:uncharacterized protein LOC109611746 [Musca domestica]